MKILRVLRLLVAASRKADSAILLLIRSISISRLSYLAEDLPSLFGRLFLMLCAAFF